MCCSTVMAMSLAPTGCAGCRRRSWSIARAAGGRVVRVVALRVERGAVVERFSALLNPGTRVPRYVLTSARIEQEAREELPTSEAIFDDVEQFLARRPICGQEAQLAWAFLQ